MSALSIDVHLRDARPRRLRLRHWLMLLLALEALVLGSRGAERYRPPGITVEQSVMAGHVIT